MKREIFFKTWDYIVGLLFILTSGTIIWNGILSPAVAFILLFIVSVVNVVFRGITVYNLNNIGMCYCIYIAVFSFSSTFFIYSNPVENTALGYIVAMLASFFIIAANDFYYFRDILTNIVYLLVLIGIPIFILTEFDMLPLQSINVGGRERIMFLGFQIGWPGHFHRFAGLWHEPGACQIILNTILILHYREITHWKWRKGQLKKIIVIALGVCFTQSAMGYIVLLLYIVAIMFGLQFKISKIRMLIFSLFCLGGLFFIYNTSIIQDKLNGQTRDGNESVSFNTRYNENEVMLNMFKERPFLGYGLGSYDQVSIIKNKEASGMSNGILYMLSGWGLVWAIPFIILFIRNLKKMKYIAPPLLLFALFVLMNSNERYMEYPITYLFLFPFRSHRLY